MAFFGYFLSPRKESNPPEARNKRVKKKGEIEIPFFLNRSLGTFFRERKYPVGDKKMEKKVPRGRQKEKKYFGRGFPRPFPFYFPAKYDSVSATFRSISCRSASSDGNFTSPRSRL